METKVPRPRQPRVLGLAAVIALFAMLLPATAGIALGHAVSVHCDQITNDKDYGTSVVYVHGTSTVVIASFAAGATATIAPGTYDIKWGDGYQESSVVVGKCSPTIDTVDSPSTGTVGVAMTVGDTATLHAPVTFVTGTSVAFTLYSNNNCTTSTGVTGTGSLNASGIASYSTSWTPPAVGTYYWKVSFPGDTYNNSVSACGGTHETVDIGKASPSIATVDSPSTGTVGVEMQVGDQATLTGGAGYATNDSVVFSLYSGTAPSACLGTALFTGSAALIGGVATYSKTWTPPFAGTYTWGVSFGGDTNNNKVSACGGANETITISDKIATSISTKLSESTGKVGDSVFDQASLSTLPIVFTANLPVLPAFTGTVTYAIYSDGKCKNIDKTAGTDMPIVNGVVPPSNTVKFDSVGTWWWMAFYSGDNNYHPAVSACEEEELVIGQSSPDIFTTPVDENTGDKAGLAPDKVHDTAILAGVTTTASGTVTYTLFKCTDDTCTSTTTSQPGGIVNVTGPTVPNSNTITIDSDHTGYYCWTADYSGDADNAAVKSKCTLEIIGVGKVSGETGTPPPTSTGGSGPASNATPLMALLICLAFGALGLTAVEAQRRTIRR